ncbi:hypothetical protein P4B35_23795 [Pontiellaceae bacterium B12227]|nr:hypothetical protein [Pontiellaceae bacterium B12227]
MKIRKLLAGILGASVVATATPFEREEQKAQLESLIDEALPFAEMMLKNHQEFYPFGVTMSPDKEIGNVGGWTGEEHPPSMDLINLLRKSYKKDGAEGKIMACALIYDIRTIPPKQTEKTDAVAIDLDHRDGMSITMVYPYKLNEEKIPVWGEPFAVAGKNLIFAKQKNG